MFHLNPLTVVFYGPKDSPFHGGTYPFTLKPLRPNNDKMAIQKLSWTPVALPQSPVKAPNCNEVGVSPPRIVHFGMVKSQIQNQMYGFDLFF